MSISLAEVDEALAANRRLQDHLRERCAVLFGALAHSSTLRVALMQRSQRARRCRRVWRHAGVPSQYKAKRERPTDSIACPLSAGRLSLCSTTLKEQFRDAGAIVIDGIVQYATLPLSHDAERHRDALAVFPPLQDHVGPREKIPSADVEAAAAVGRESQCRPPSREFWKELCAAMPNPRATRFDAAAAYVTAQLLCNAQTNSDDSSTDISDSDENNEENNEENNDKNEEGSEGEVKNRLDGSTDAFAAHARRITRAARRRWMDSVLRGRSSGTATIPPFRWEPRRRVQRHERARARRQEQARALQHEKELAQQYEEALAQRRKRATRHALCEHIGAAEALAYLLAQRGGVFGEGVKMREVIRFMMPGCAHRHLMERRIRGFYRMEEILLERCILRTHSLNAYRRFIAAECGALLPSLLSHRKSLLRVGEEIPSVGDRPVLTVVDLTPATQGTLTAETTVIVLPPQEEPMNATQSPNILKEPTDQFVFTGNVCDNDNDNDNDEDDDEDVCVVVLDESLPSGSAAAPFAFFARALLPLPMSTPSTLLCGDAEYATAMDVSLLETFHKDTVTAMHAGRDAFRNIRAAALLDPQPSVLLCCNSYASRRLRVRLSLFRAFDSASLLSSSSSPSHLSSPSVSSSPLRRVAFAPAWPDAVMSSVFGSRHSTVTALALRAAHSALDGRLVSEGDVIAVPAEPLGFVRAQLDVSDVSEASLLRAAHMALSGNAATTASVMSSFMTETSAMTSVAMMIPLRVVSVDPFPSGRLSLAAAVTEVVLRRFEVARDEVCADATPLFAPMENIAGRQVFAKLSLTHSVREAMGDCYAPRMVSTKMKVNRDTDDNNDDDADNENNDIINNNNNNNNEDDDTILVVHVARDNMPCECIAAAVAHFGVCCAITDLDRRDDAEMTAIFTDYMNSGGEVALIVRNAQCLPDRPHVLRLLDLFGPQRHYHRYQHNGKGETRRNRIGTRVIFLICESPVAVPPQVAARARNAHGVVRGTNPSDADRKVLLESVFSAAASAFGLRQSLLLSLEDVASWTVGLSAADVWAYGRACVAAMASRHYANGVWPVLSESHCSNVLKTFQRAHGHSVVSTQLQPVRWKDVGGLEDAKRELRETIQMPILYPELFGAGTKRRTGVLFYGPPGCGKTLLAKAVATEMNMNFMSVKGPELINQYVGESELNIRLLFQRARDNSPCIVFFDELDALAPQRGEKGDAGGAMDRVVAQLLVELDGVGQTRSDGTSVSQVFIIGATNRPDLLDPSLLRPGRFDRLCYLGIPATRDEQLFAVQALTRKFDMDEDVNLSALLEPLSFQYTGADFFALCSDAMMFAVVDMLEEAKANMNTATATVTTKGKTAEPRLVVNMSHFLRARSQLKPSVAAEDLRRYESLKTKFATR